MSAVRLAVNFLEHLLSKASESVSRSQTCSVQSPTLVESFPSRGNIQLVFHGL